MINEGTTYDYIKLFVGKSYLKCIDNESYSLKINDVIKKIPELIDYTPICMVGSNDKPLILIKKNIASYATDYIKIGETKWIGINDKMRTVGIICSKNYPKNKYPVFEPNKLCQATQSAINIYSDDNYGYWIPKINSSDIDTIYLNDDEQLNLKMIENDEPWYKNDNIVGADCATKLDAHNITGYAYDTTNKNYNKMVNSAILLIMIIVLMVCVIKIVSNRYHIF